MQIKAQIDFQTRHKKLLAKRKSTLVIAFNYSEDFVNNKRKHEPKILRFVLFLSCGASLFISKTISSLKCNFF